MSDALPNYYREERPWGAFIRFTHNEQSTVKILEVSEGEAFSEQYHEHRSEFWRVISGNGTILVGDKETEAKEGDEFFIPQGAIHRMTGGSGGIKVLEVALGEFDENDIVRTKDKYGRV